MGVLNTGEPVEETGEVFKGMMDDGGKRKTRKGSPGGGAFL